MRLIYAIILGAVLVIIFLSYTADIIWVKNQEAAGNDSLFIVIYTMGEGWDESKSPDEQTYFKEHSSFLSNLHSEKTILIGGRYSDKGMIIIKAADYPTAKNIIESDSAVISKTFNSEIYPINFFYKGCIQ
jgi:uncharacterized protein YciI